MRKRESARTKSRKREIVALRRRIDRKLGIPVEPFVRVQFDVSGGK